MEYQIFVVDCPYTAYLLTLRQIRCPSEAHLQHTMTIAPTRVFSTGVEEPVELWFRNDSRLRSLWFSTRKETSMRTLLLSTVAFAALAGSAFAADLPSRKEAPVYLAPTPVFSWTGFYVGGDIGAAFSATLTNPAYTYNASYIPWTGHSFNSSGFMGGGYLGYNYQLNQNFVVGLEGDFQARPTASPRPGRLRRSCIRWRASPPSPAWTGWAPSTAVSASPMIALCSTPSAARRGAASASAAPLITRAFPWSASRRARPCPASISARASSTPSPRTGWAAWNIAITASATTT